MTDSAAGPALLVFGAGGQVGEELRRLGARAGIPVRALPRAEADITDPAAVRAAVCGSGARVVVNAAAYTKVDLAESESAAARAINAEAPGHVAAACREAGLPLLHLSTDYVFDGTKGSPYRECDPVAPLGVYGSSKEAGERAVRQALDRHVIVRTAWVFAAHGHNFVRTMLRLGESRDHLRVVDDQRGSPTSAADIAAALLQIARRVTAAPDSAPWGTYHFTNAGSTTWHGFATAVFAERRRLTGAAPPRIDPITTADYPTPARRPAYSLLDCACIADAFGVRPRPWAAALSPVMEEILVHEPVFHHTNP